MQRAFSLAIKGLGKVSPNPLVGCVVVHKGKIIGEGFHEKYGGKHAEVNAIESVKNKELLKESQVYVTLEPCSHYGKTPPCTDLLSKYQVKEVIIATKDPNESVKGDGIGVLKNSGIKVIAPFLGEKAREINRRFITDREQNRPYIILKWAQSKDGYISPNFNTKGKISNEASLTLVHKWRTEEDAILVGSITAMKDNPQLTSRLWEGKNPIRVVFGNPNLHKECYLLDGKVKTIFFNIWRTSRDGSTQWIRVDRKNFLKEAISIMHQEGIQSVLVEGGTRTLNGFIESGLWDESRVFTAPADLEGGTKAPEISGVKVLELFLDDDRLVISRNYHG